MTRPEDGAATVRPASVSRKSPPWGERLVKAQKRPRKPPIPKVTPRTARQDPFLIYYSGQSFTKEAEYFSRSLQLYHREWTRYLTNYRSSIAASQLGFVDLRTVSERILFLSDPPEVESGPLQSVVQTPQIREPREFNMSVAVWSAFSETVQSIIHQSIWAWVAGALVVSITWLLGGFDFVIRSAMGLAAFRSVVRVLVDIRRGNFSATGTFRSLAEFLYLMGLIALGRLLDYGTHEPLVIARSIMAYIVISVGFWQSFRGLALLAGLQGVDALIQAEIDTFVDWINRQRQTPE